MEQTEKRIETCELKIGELQDKIGNPRVISKKKMNELKESLTDFGDFGVIVVDEDNNIISGHQRVAALMNMSGEDTKVLCKRLVGYSTEEKMAINLKANTHAGEWDLSKLADWTSRLTVKVGLDLPQVDTEDIKIPDMELIRYEKYDYVMLVCRNEIDYLNLTRALGIEDKKVMICHAKKGDRKIKCRAIWYDKMKAKIVPLQSK